MSETLTQASASAPAPDTVGTWRARAVTPLILCAIILAIAVLAQFAEPLVQRRVILCMVWMVAVIGLYVFMGNSGVLNFSTVAFMGVGAYASALVTMAPEAKALFLPDLPMWLAALHLPPFLGPAVAVGIGLVVSVIVGWPLMRLSGIAAGIATFSVMLIAYVVLGNWTSLTGGQTSLTGVVTFVTLPVAAGYAAAAVLVAHLFQESRFCLPLRASREDEVAARATGASVQRLRLIAFVLGSGMGALAGALMGHFQGTLRVESFYFDATFLLVSMLVLGGTRSLSGAVFGTLAVSLLTELLRLVEAGFNLPIVGKVAAPAGSGDLIVAGAMLLILIYRPSGLTGGREVGAMLKQTKRDPLKETRNA